MEEFDEYEQYLMEEEQQTEEIKMEQAKAKAIVQKLRKQEEEKGPHAFRQVDFLTLPKELNSSKRLDKLYSFRVNNKTCFGPKFHYLIDTESNKFYKLEKRRLMNSVFLGKKLLHQPSEIIMSPVHPCMIFMEAFLNSSNQIDEIDQKDIQQKTFTNIFKVMKEPDPDDFKDLKSILKDYIDHLSIIKFHGDEIEAEILDLLDEEGSEKEKIYSKDENFDILGHILKTPSIVSKLTQITSTLSLSPSLPTYALSLRKLYIFLGHKFKSLATSLSPPPLTPALKLKCTKIMFNEVPNSLIAYSFFTKVNNLASNSDLSKVLFPPEPKPAKPPKYGKEFWKARQKGKSSNKNKSKSKPKSKNMGNQKYKFYISSKKKNGGF